MIAWPLCSQFPAAGWWFLGADSWGGPCVGGGSRPWAGQMSPRMVRPVTLIPDPPARPLSTRLKGGGQDGGSLVAVDDILLKL